MERTLTRRQASWALTALLLARAAPARSGAGPQPLVGTWKLDSQEINGQKQEHEPLTLRITQAGQKLNFAFSIPVNGIYFVSMSYTTALDGKEADVKNVRGEKIGTVQVTESNSSNYKLVLHGQGRPDSTGKLTLSQDGKTLVSESDSERSGRHVHLLQRFTRND